MDLVTVFLTLGGLFLAGLAADLVGRQTRLPRVTLLNRLWHRGGRIRSGPAARDRRGLVSVSVGHGADHGGLPAGSSLTIATLRRSARAIFLVSIAIVLASVAVVADRLWVLGVPLEVALVLAAIASATAPAATQDVIRQAGRTGPFVDTLKGIVAIDDAWGLIVFSLSVAAVGLLTADDGPWILAEATWEIAGALCLGLAVGLPAAHLTGRLQPGEPLQAEALGIVFATAGLSLWLDVSFLIAAMTAGAVIVNLAGHHRRAFHEIEHFQWPFMILFFILAGASLDLDALPQVGAVGLAYVALRTAARSDRGSIGGAMAGMPAAECRWIGIALLPQAGVAIGMALVAAQRFPDHAGAILTVTVASTVIFEIIGRWAR